MAMHIVVNHRRVCASMVWTRFTSSPAETLPQRQLPLALRRPVFPMPGTNQSGGKSNDARLPRSVLRVLPALIILCWKQDRNMHPAVLTYLKKPIAGRAYILPSAIIPPRGICAQAHGGSPTFRPVLFLPYWLRMVAHVARSLFIAGHPMLRVDLWKR